MTALTDELVGPQNEPDVDPSDSWRPPRGRSLWVVFGSLLLIAGLGWGTYNGVELIAHEERTERFTVPADELTRLYVDNDTGSVTIVGTDSDVITVDAEVSDGLQSTGFSREVVDSTLELRGSCPLIGSIWCRVTYRIEVPRDLDIEVDSDDDRVVVSDLDGAVVIDSDNGAVELADLAGSVDVSADNGRIVGTDLSSSEVRVDATNGRIELAFTVPPSSLVANGENGRIEVVVPEVEGGYAVTADSDNGGVDIEVVNNPDSPYKIGLQTDNGSITVRSAG